MRTSRKAIESASRKERASCQGGTEGATGEGAAGEGRNWVSSGSIIYYRRSIATIEIQKGEGQCLCAAVEGF